MPDKLKSSLDTEGDFSMLGEILQVAKKFKN